MKHVILMRHAKAAAADSDHERPLAPRGQREAARMGPAIAALGTAFEPGCVLCSSAQRALETWEGVRSALPDVPPARILESLYLASPAHLLGELQGLPAEVDAVLLIGHEPGLSQLTRTLADRASVDVQTRAQQGMAPGTLAALRFEFERWERVGPASGELVEFRGPRDLAVR